MESPSKAQGKVTNKVYLGENKAIAALTFETEGGKLELGAIFHIPTRQEGTKTFYKPLACKIAITSEQRADIVRMLGGVMKEESP